MTLASKEVYLTHYIKQSCGWVKVAEYACTSERKLQNMQRALRGEATSEEVRLEVRRPK